MFKNKGDIYSLVVFLLTIIVGAVAYGKLPDRVPMHWNVHGQVDSYGPKIIILLMVPGIMLFMWLLMRFLPKIDPKKANYEKFGRSYSIMINLFLTFFFLMQIVTILASLGYNIKVEKIIPIAVGVLFIIIGNYLPKSKSNFFYGIKTPWTLSSEVSWNKTHRLGGKLFVISGVLTIIGTIFFTSTIAFIILMASIMTASIVPIIASYYYSK